MLTLLNNNYWHFLSRSASRPISAHSPVYSLPRPVTAIFVDNFRHRSPGGGEGRVTGRRRESNPQPADRRMRDRLPRPLGHPAPYSHRLSTSNYPISTIGFSFAETCFSAIYFKVVDRSARNLGTRVSECDLIFHKIL